MRVILCLCLCLLLPRLLSAQSYDLQLHRVDGPLTALTAEVPLPEKFSSQQSPLAWLQHLPQSLHEKGYLAASVDSFFVSDLHHEAWVFIGPKYRWTRLSMRQIPPAVLLAANIQERQWTGQPLSPARFARLTGSLLRWADDNGYPFARTGLDSLVLLEGGGVSANLVLELGEPRRLDSVAVTGNVKISPSFLYRYLELQPGAPYSEARLRVISARLRELPYLRETHPPEVSFQRFGTRLTLHLEERKANQLNALIGLQPNTGGTSKFLITADAQLAFQNVLSYGESLGITYQNLQARSPRLRADLVWPYLFGTPFGADVHFDLFKRDSSFTRVSLQAGLRYSLSANDYLRVYYDHRSNNLGTIDTAYIRRTRQLPDNADSRASGLGLELATYRTDYRPSPRRGWSLRAGGSALRRRVLPSNAVTGLADGSGFDYASLYDSLAASRGQYLLSGELAGYLPVGKQLVLKTAYAGGWVGGGRLFQNELYQIGGFRLLRGFDEQSIFASQYHLVLAELRLLIDRNSYVFAFSDNAWVETAFGDVRSEGFYNGFGLGAALESGSGLFTIGLALGSSPLQAVQFRQSKVYLGYVAFF